MTTFLDGVTALLSTLRLKRYSPGTVDGYSDQLKRFGQWLNARRIHDLRTLTKAQLLDYQRHVKSEPITRETQALRIRAVKRLFEHLVDQGTLLLNPAEGLQEISRRQKLPRPVLSKREVDRLLNAPNVSLRIGIRDRALLEVLYATGVRVGELEKATIHHVDLAMQTLQVRHAKGGRPRVVPLGANATRWLKEYLTQVRPWLARGAPFERRLFVVIGGRVLAQTQIRNLLRQYASKAKLRKKVSPHLLRHTCATHMLAAGADIRAIQELLGHIRLQSTTTYTRVAPVDVKQAHQRFHPLNQDAHAPA